MKMMEQITAMTIAGIAVWWIVGQMTRTQAAKNGTSSGPFSGPTPWPQYYQQQPTQGIWV